MNNSKHHPASFRDPSGFVFQRGSVFYRQVNQSYKEEYELFMSSGLYPELTARKYLLAHQEMNENLFGNDEEEAEKRYKTILPEQLSFISYPYEWCFEQLKDAALLTIAIQKTCIRYGMVLKDATPYNVQFHQGQPVFIDTLSFEKYDASLPWVAYRQFCECFLFPLFLQKYLEVDVQKLMLSYPEGIPAGITKELLPWKSNFNLGVGLHVSLQSKIKPGNQDGNYQGKFSEKKMLHLLNHLEENIKSCTINRKNKTTWNNYYTETIPGKSYLPEKESVFTRMINSIPFKTVLDIGANDGFFSKIIAEKAALVVSIDFDARCVNSLYSSCREAGRKNILPLCMDFANPTPAIGFNNEERSSFLHRAKFDLVLALALIHHLALSKNIPLEHIAESFHRISKTAIVEFVSKEDEKVKQLLLHREDIFTEYNEAGFLKAFGKYFKVGFTAGIQGTCRTLYLLERKDI